MTKRTKRIVHDITMVVALLALVIMAMVAHHSHQEAKKAFEKAVQEFEEGERPRAKLVPLEGVTVEDVIKAEERARQQERGDVATPRPNLRVAPEDITIELDSSP